jgi:hypothetical protein
VQTSVQHLPQRTRSSHYHEHPYPIPIRQIGEQLYDTLRAPEVDPRKNLVTPTKSFALGNQYRVGEFFDCHDDEWSFFLS